MGFAEKPKHRVARELLVLGKKRIVEVMCELEPGKTKKSASKEYDNVTRAINGLLNAYSRALPQGLHVRIRMNDCYTLNLCWLRSRPGKWAAYPRLWVTPGERVRGRMRALQIAEYYAWKARGKM